MNELNVSLQHSIATLAANGWSARKIARELNIHRETVGRPSIQGSVNGIVIFYQWLGLFRW